MERARFVTMSTVRERSLSPRNIFGHAIVRYAFAVGTVVAAFALRKFLEPLTGTGAPFVLFFGVVLISSLVAGYRAGILAALLAAPLSAYAFILHAGFSASQAAYQAAFFLADCAILIYLSVVVSRARRASESAEARLRLANQAAAIGCWELDVANHRLRWSPDLAFPGGGPATVDQWLSLVHSADRDAFGRDHARSLDPAGDGALHTEVRLVRPDGVVRWFSWLGRTHFEETTGGRVPARQLGIAVDVTERREREDAVTRMSAEVARSASHFRELLGREQAARQDAEAANARLRESEERFRLTIDEAPIGIALVSLGGRFVRVNRALCEIIGFAKDELERLTYRDITHPEDVDLDQERIGQLARGEIPRYQLEKRYIRKDGGIVTVLLSASVLPASDQTPLYFIAQIEDITVRKRAEEALRTSEREFRLLAESMPQIVWATTAEGLNVYFNPQWVEYTGLTLEESPGDRWIVPFHPDDRQRAWDAWQHATRHRATYALECRMRRADGVYRWWLIRGVPVLGANGEIEKWFGTCTDIDDLKVAEQRLQESEAKFSGIVAISADAIISIDQDQRITIFNSGAEQIYGYSQAEVVGTPLERLIPERHRNATRQYLKGFASGTVTAQRMGERLTTIAGLRKNGEEFPAEAAISKLEVGDATLLTVALRDVSERKRIEKEQRLLAEAGAVLAHCSTMNRRWRASPSWSLVTSPTGAWSRWSRIGRSGG